MLEVGGREGQPVLHLILVVRSVVLVMSGKEPERVALHVGCSIGCVDMAEERIAVGDEVDGTVLVGHGVGRSNGLDGSVGVKLHAVYADLTVNAGLLVSLDEVFVDAMIDNIPFVRARNVYNGVVSRAVDGVRRILLDDDWLLCHGDGTERRLGCAVSHMVIGRACVVNGPHKIIDTVTIKHVRCLAIGIVLQRAALGSEHLQRLRLDGGHVLL